MNSIFFFTAITSMVWHTFSTTSEKENSEISNFSSLLSALARINSWSISLAITLVSEYALSSQISFSSTVPSSSLKTASKFVCITVRGVLSSWDASATNSLCLFHVSLIGVNAFPVSI